jgi:hypothetical protein
MAQEPEALVQAALVQMDQALVQEVAAPAQAAEAVAQVVEAVGLDLKANRNGLSLSLSINP